MKSVTNNYSPEVWLAPMSGATDAPFRRQVMKFGATQVVSEMTASEQLIASRPDVVRRTCRHKGDGLWIVQLAGRKPEHMQAAASLLAEAGVDMIDINMGCPSRKVTGGLSGSALMREPELADAIIHATLAGAGSVPVSLKMRLGWDDRLLNAPDIARRAEAAGIVRLAVHGRTRCQFYQGQADWQRIRDTVKAVSLPVIANGDIVSLGTAKEALAQSGACGVMIGRAAIGRPWLPAQISAGLSGRPFALPTLRRRLQSLCEQVGDAVAFYGEGLGVRVCRKHISAGIRDMPLGLAPDDLRLLQASLCRLESANTLIDQLQALTTQSNKELCYV